MKNPSFCFFALLNPSSSPELPILGNRHSPDFGIRLGCRISDLVYQVCFDFDFVHFWERKKFGLSNCVVSGSLHHWLLISSF